MRLSAEQIAKLVGGELQGDSNVAVTGVAPLSEASASDLSFVSDPKYYKDLPASKAGVVLVHKQSDVNGRTVVRVDNPQVALVQVLNVIAREKEQLSSGVHPSAVVAKDARIGQNVFIGPHCVVETGAEIGDGSRLEALCYVGRGARLGKNCRLYPQVTLREEVSLGNEVVIHSGSVIGTDGFGYVFHQKQHHKIPQIGTVEIGDRVEIGSNVTIDRATLGKTVIGAGTKIDNLVQIAHNVRVGEGCIIVAQAGIAGSSKLGNFVTLAGQVGVADHATLGDGVIAAAQSGIPSNNVVPPGSIVFGSPARPIREERKIQAIIGKLPEIYSEFRALKRKLSPEDKGSE